DQRDHREPVAHGPLLANGLTGLTMDRRWLPAGSGGVLSPATHGREPAGVSLRACACGLTRFAVRGGPFPGKRAAANDDARDKDKVAFHTPVDFRRNTLEARLEMIIRP